MTSIPSDRVVAYRHPVAGFTLPLPVEWERAEDPRPDIALIAIEPEHAGPFRANVVVTVERLPDGLDADAWQAGADELLGQALHGYLLLDRERLELDGRAVIRRLAHHAREETGAITMEQWATVHDGMGFTLTASAGTLEYDALADTFAGMAEGFHP
jgi:hypothetical protein